MSFGEYNSIPLQRVIDNFKMEIVYRSDNMSEVGITARDITRPGLPLAGFFEHMDTTRIGIIGNAEHQFLASKDSDERYACVSAYFSHHPAAIVFSSNNEVFEEVLRAAQEYNIPILRSGERTSALTASVNAFARASISSEDFGSLRVIKNSS